jgi:hypothetical protein
MVWTRAGVSVLSVLVLAGPGWEQLAAQQEPAVQLQGRVIDDVTLDPIKGATVVLFDSYGVRLARRVTDEHGAFSFEVADRAAARLRAGRIGYQQVTTPLLQFDGRKFFSVEVRLHVEAVLLAPLEIVARAAPARSSVFSGFDMRVRSGMGSYFTREDVEAIQPSLVTDLLARLPGVHLEGSGRANRRTVTMGRHAVGPGGGPCPVQIFLDGHLITPRSSQSMTAGRFDTNVYIDDLVNPSAVEGIEVYRGTATVPAEFMNSNSRCGVVAIWTRRGG